MSEVNFTTHLLKAFTDKYGEPLQKYFINDALLGKYLSAGEMYHFIFPEADEENRLEEANKADEETKGKTVYRTTPRQSTFNRNYIKTINFVNDKLKSNAPAKLQLEDFFAGKLDELNVTKKSEYSYWENLFVYAWIKSQNRQFGFSVRQLELEKPEINKAINLITKEKEWYKASLYRNMLWSIELFRLKLLLDEMKDNTFNFIYVLDWIDIFEFRIVTVVLQRIVEAQTNKSQGLSSLSVEKYFIAVIRSVSEFPFAERFNLEKNQRKSIWNMRKEMLPQKKKSSDVNIDGDIEIYARFVNLIKEKAGQKVESQQVRDDIRSIISARNKLRNVYKSNGSSYMCAFLTIQTTIGNLDDKCIKECLVLFKKLTENNDFMNQKNIISVIEIYHMLICEMQQMKKDDILHYSLEYQIGDLKMAFGAFQKKILEYVFNTYTTSKRLFIRFGLDDIEDELLSEMIMVGSRLLKKNQSDSLLNKIFEKKQDWADVERNKFINLTWSKMDVRDKAIFYICANMNGKMDRINCTGEEYLSSDEKEFIDRIVYDWNDELNRIHRLLQLQ